MLLAVQKQVLLCVTATIGAETFSFDRQVTAAAGCAYGKCCVRILGNATLISTQDFLGRRDITWILAGNNVFDTVTRLLVGDFVV